MGWWSASIMGGDQPLDIEFSFEQKFGKKRVPTADEGLAFLTEMLSGDDDPVTKQVVAFLIMKRRAPMHDEVRRAALEGIAEEDTSNWNHPAERDATLAQFGELVKAYPSAGGASDLPHQPGLFETIARL